MLWLPTFKLDVVKLAVVVPPLVVGAPWLTLLPLSKKVTIPVGLSAL